MRRSARNSLATPLIASMLRETEFAYAPNEALPRRRPSMFESPTLDTQDATASVQAEDDNASTPTSVTGYFHHRLRSLYRCLKSCLGAWSQQ